MSSLKHFTKKVLENLLEPYGYELAKRKHDWDKVEEFIPFKETLREADEAGMSVADYVDTRYNHKGATQETVDRMAAFGVFDGDMKRICEIGPGSGRYLEKVLGLCAPEYYEIYETAGNWAQWLVQKYKINLQPTDGISLSATPSGSIDLVQAHKVFVCTPILITSRYLDEMVRIVRPKGKIVFDILTENCMDEPTLKRWMDSGIKSGPYPAMTPRQYVIDLLDKRRVTLDGSFFIPMRPGMTECFVFTKDA